MLLAMVIISQTILISLQLKKSQIRENLLKRKKLTLSPFPPNIT